LTDYHSRISNIIDYKQFKIVKVKLYTAIVLNTMEEINSSKKTMQDNAQDSTSWWVRGHVRGYNSQGRMVGKVVEDAFHTVIVLGLVAFAAYTTAKGMDGASAVMLMALMGVLAWVSDPPRHLGAWIIDN
jgi:hypothetical protein